MTTDKQDPSRTAFEAQMKSEGRSVNRSEAHNGYFAYETDVRWQTWQPAWQASRKQALASAEDRVTTLYEAQEPPYLVDICKAIKELLK